MPLLERNKLRAEVTFGAASFIAGQTLHGSLKLYVAEPIILRALRATHIVVEQVRPMSKRESRVGVANQEPQNIVYDRKSYERELFLVGSPMPGAHPFSAGMYTFPFTMEIPSTLPPSMALTKLGTKGQAKHLGALIQHTLRIDANISGALFNFNQSFPVRVTNACVYEQYCQARDVTVPQQAPAHSFMAVSPGFAHTFPSATYAAEQAEFRLSLPRPMVSLADDGFLPFRVAGLIPCRYEVRLHRTCTVQIKKRSKTFDSVVASTVMPALPQHGIAEGSIPLDASRLLGLTNLTGQRLASVQHHVSIHLLYDRGVFVDVDDKLRAKVPVVLVPSLYNANGSDAGARAMNATVDVVEDKLSSQYGATDARAEVPVMGQVLQAPGCAVSCSA